MMKIATNKWAYGVWVCLSWSCEGGHFTIFPPLAGLIYGVDKGGQINALFFVGMSIASLTGVLLTTFMLPFTGWGPLFSTMGAMSLISLFMLFFFSETR